MRGKTREILKLYSDGLSRAEIARQLNCSAANVSIAISRHGVWDHSVRGLPRDHQEWLLDRAKKMRIHPGDMAARLLAEIIDMYKTGDI